ncbi:Amastin surface glycoprotein [Novymonas esmeraldas]|uniref:Amastin surface glycoprotein n=1 Tax=Novymonas esmeraldas TaxID=1808958 RepID=A0AAW0FA82_9TRYP
MKCRIFIRVVVLLCAVIAVALAVVGVFMPFFEMPSTVNSTVQSLNTSLHSPSFNVATEASTLQRFGALIGGPPANSKMTLWKVTYGTSGANNSVDLRDDYFTCYKGNMLIQAAEGVAVVACALGAANLILSIFLFLFSAVVKFPLSVYFFLSAAAAAVTFGLALNLYLHGWCSVPPLQSSEWNLSLGFAFFVISCGVSLIGSVLTLFSD